MKEPTIRDVVDIMNDRFDRIDARLVHVEASMADLQEITRETVYRLGKVESAVLDFQEDLKGGLRVIDANSLKLIDHERRIRRIEKKR